jgi:neutral trehalase
MDNSPRFDGGRPLYGVDLSCFVVNELETLAAIADRLGRHAEALRWRGMARDLSIAINDRLWDEDAGFYYDRMSDGSLVRVKTAAGFTTLFAGVATAARAERLIEHLSRHDEFRRPLPVPTVAACEPSYSRDMWRGPVWANYNYLICRGLVRYGRNDLALAIARSTVQAIADWYHGEGVVFEYYDAEGACSPRQLPRKGATGGEWVHTVIRDYHWTAALYVALAHAFGAQLAPDGLTPDRS